VNRFLCSGAKQIPVIRSDRNFRNGSGQFYDAAGNERIAASSTPGDYPCIRDARKLSGKNYIIGIP